LILGIASPAVNVSASEDARAYIGIPPPASVIDSRR